MGHERRGDAIPSHDISGTVEGLSIVPDNRESKLADTGSASGGVRYVGELAYSGNWKLQCERVAGSGNTLLPQTDLAASLGTQYDFEGALALAPGASRNLPEVAFTASAGDLDEAANQMHRYQR